jgi:uncharacterized paraquat-inducible protein A
VIPRSLIENDNFLRDNLKSCGSCGFFFLHKSNTMCSGCRKKKHRGKRNAVEGLI